MPRRPRIHNPEGFYHIVTRGDNREAVFIDDRDRQDYLRLVSALKGELRFECHAYALMTNHVHLLLRPGIQTTVSQVMQQLSGRYAQIFNRRHGRVGHLYQGRFYSGRVDEESYLLEAVRYIHLNPVRAGIVSHPVQYPWTSYHAYMEPQQDPLRLVDSAFILAMIDAESLTQRRSFRLFLETSLHMIRSMVDVDLGEFVERNGQLVPRRGRPKGSKRGQALLG